MRKTVILSAAVAALFIGSIFVGVAAATTGAPALYDARSPRPVATGAGDLVVEAGGAQGDGRQAVADGADTDDAPLPGSPTSPKASPAPTPGPTPAPSPTTPVPDPIPTADEQQAWLGFQQLVRECMAEAGHEYREWTWWTTEPRNPRSTAPAMPEGLTAEAEAAWRLALEGDGGENDGCLGEAVRADQAKPVVPPKAPAPPPPPPTATPDAGAATPDAGTATPDVPVE
ncbi:hypothetical protein ACWGST_10325 [Agromyces sp. NPDC055520]